LAAAPPPGAAAFCFNFRRSNSQSLRLLALSRPPRRRRSTMPALIDAAHYRRDSRQAALRAQYEAAASGIRAEFLAEVAKIQNGE
jgi:hypothetical protein